MSRQKAFSGGRWGGQRLALHQHQDAGRGANRGWMKVGLCPQQRGHPPGAQGKAKERGLELGNREKVGTGPSETERTKDGDMQAGWGLGLGVGLGLRDGVWAWGRVWVWSRVLTEIDSVVEGAFSSSRPTHTSLIPTPTHPQGVNQPCQEKLHTQKN